MHVDHFSDRVIVFPLFPFFCSFKLHPCARHHSTPGTTMMVAIYPALQQPVPGTVHQPPWTALGFLQQLCRISIVSQTTKPGAAPLWQWLSTTTTPTPANRMMKSTLFWHPVYALMRSFVPKNEKKNPQRPGQLVVTVHDQAAAGAGPRRAHHRLHHPPAVRHRVRNV